VQGNTYLNCDTALNYETALLECASGSQSSIGKIYAREKNQLRGVAHRIAHDLSRAEDVIHEAFAQIAPGRFHLLARPFEKLLAPLGIIRSLSFPNAILGVLLVVPEATRT
jgi:hypothetical protein